MQASPKPHKSDRTPASGPRLDSSGLLIPIRFPVVRHAYVAAAPPELLSPLRTLDQVQAFAAERCIGASLPDTLGDPLGFFLFKLFLQCYTNAAAAIEFIEDVVAFKGTAAASARAVIASEILSKYGALWEHRLPSMSSCGPGKAASAPSATCDDENLCASVSLATESVRTEVWEEDEVDDPPGLDVNIPSHHIEGKEEEGKEKRGGRGESEGRKGGGGEREGKTITVQPPLHARAPSKPRKVVAAGPGTSDSSRVLKPAPSVKLSTGSTSSATIRSLTSSLKESGLLVTHAIEQGKQAAPVRRGSIASAEKPSISVVRPTTADSSVEQSGRKTPAHTRRATVAAPPRKPSTGKPTGGGAGKEPLRPETVTPSISRREMKHVLTRSPQDTLLILLRGFAISKLAPQKTLADIWRDIHAAMFPCRAAVHSSTGGESPSVFPSHIHGCDCASTVLIPPELFDSAVSLVLSDMETHYFPTFGTVNPFFLGYVQLFHFGASRRPPNVRTWKWIGKIGRGGYGAVYLVQRVDTGYLYAVKCIDKRAVKLRRAIKLVMNERKALAACDCPFLPALRYAFQTREHVFMVTDVMTGGDLDRRIRAIAAAAGTAATHSPARAASGKSMEAWGVHPGMLEAHAQFYMAEVILALRHMHQKGITHRDIKPANVLLDAEGHIQLADLGLAVFLTSRATAAVERRHTFGSKVVPKFGIRGRAGTPGFWAPEMLGTDEFGKAPEYTSAVDFYSLGAFLFNLLAGKAPPVPETQAGEVVVPVFPEVPAVDGTHTPTRARPRRNACVSPALWESLLLPASLSLEGKDLLKQLLEPQPEKRLGSNAEDFDRLMSHGWFKGLDWDLVAARKCTPPWIPSHDAMSIKSSHNAGMPIYDQCIDAKLEDIELTAVDQEGYAGMEYCDEAAIRTEIIANMVGRGHSKVLKALFKAKPPEVPEAAKPPAIVTTLQNLVYADERSMPRVEKHGRTCSIM